jgi:hypothetical protein
MPVRSLLLPFSLTVTSVTLTWALCWEPRLLSFAVMVAKSSRGSEEGTGPLDFPFDRVVDRMVCSIGVRNKRLNDIGVDTDEEGWDGPWGFGNLERFVGNVGGGGGGGGSCGCGSREDLEEDGMRGVG